MLTHHDTALFQWYTNRSMKDNLGFNGFKSAVFARVWFPAKRLQQQKGSAPCAAAWFLAPGLQVICPIWWTYPCSPTAFHTFHASSSSKSWCQWEPPHFIGKIRVPQWRVKGVSISKNSCIVLQQHHCHPQAHSQVWFGAKLITMLQAKWFVYVKTLQLQNSSSLHNSKAWSFKNHRPQGLPPFRQKCHQEQSLRDISKVFKCVLEVPFHQTSHLKEESGLHVRFEDTSWSNRHDSCTKVTIASSAQYNDPVTCREFDWLLQLWFLFGSYSHLSCSKSRLRTWSSSSQKDQLLRGIRGFARLGLRRLSWTFQGQSWVSELSRSEGHVAKICKVCVLELFVARHTAWTTLNEIPLCTRQSRHWQPLQAMLKLAILWLHEVSLQSLQSAIFQQCLARHSSCRGSRNEFLKQSSLIGAVSRPKFVLHQFLHLVVHAKAVRWYLFNCMKKIHASSSSLWYRQMKCFWAS